MITFKVSISYAVSKKEKRWKRVNLTSVSNSILQTLNESCGLGRYSLKFLSLINLSQLFLLSTLPVPAQYTTQYQLLAWSSFYCLWEDWRGKEHCGLPHEAPSRSCVPPGCTTMGQSEVAVAQGTVVTSLPSFLLWPLALVWSSNYFWTIH